MPKKKETQIKHIREEIPITGYDEDWECFSCEDGSYIDIYQIRPKDLVNSDADEIEMDCFRWAKFYKTYGSDVQIVTLMFPCDTGQQQNYWKGKLETNRNPNFAGMIRRNIEELEWRQKHSASKEFFLFLFYPSAKEIPDAVKTLEGTMEIGDMGMVQKIPRKKKELILFKLANKNSLIFQEENDG